jgi:hypothetical protein
MDPDVRTMLLTAGLVFCGVFAVMTVVVAIEFGLSVLTFFAVAILGLLVPPLIGALRNPPDK